MASGALRVIASLAVLCALGRAASDCHAMGKAAGFPASSGLSPDLVASSGAPLRSADGVRIRELVHQHVKDDCGVAPEVLAAALDILGAEARDEGRIDMDVVHRVGDSLADPSKASLAEALLVGYAETVAFGRTVEGVLPSDAERVLVAGAKRDAIERQRRTMDDLPLDGGVTPNLGGICKSCPDVTTGIGPDFTIGSFPPSGTFAFHASSTAGPGDCNWYAFTVECGHRYEFTMCPPGSSVFDSIIEVFDASCARLAISDDECMLDPRVELTAPPAATTLYVRISGFGFGYGNYMLAYREVACTDCLRPDGWLFPTATCNYVTGCFANCVASCLEAWYRVTLVGGQGYVFTTCPHGAGGICPMANATPTTFDTELFLYPSSDCPLLTTPFASSTGTLTCTPPGSTSRAIITVTAPYTGDFLLRIRGPFGSGTNRFGCYNLGFAQIAMPPCGTCAAGPYAGTLTPTTSCQTVLGAVGGCLDTWYLVNVPRIGDLHLSTCGAAGCPGGGATFDPHLELYSPACAQLGADDDGCGGVLSYLCTGSLGSPLTPGTYRVRVRGGGMGTFTMTYRLDCACVPPSDILAMPMEGVASSGIGTCLKSESFFFTCDGSGPISYSWSITPPSGGSATPVAGSVVGGPGSDNPATITSTLRGDGVFSVTVCARNVCSPAPPLCVTFDYVLRDLTPPVLVVPSGTTVDCGSVPPPPRLVAQDNCDPDPVEGFSERTLLGSCPGEYQIRRTWTATDRAGNVTGPFRQDIDVVDATGPRIVDGGHALCMYPPNHVLHCFSTDEFDPLILDDCSPPSDWIVVAITNSEEPLGPCGPDDQDPDWSISAGGRQFCVRSERCGSDPLQNDGRIYTIFIQATDACGNASAVTPAFSILIPHDSADNSDCIAP